MKAQVDIPYTALKKAVERIEKKIGICDKLPSARFHILDDHMAEFFKEERGEWAFDGIICDQMGGESTGWGIEECQNCLRRKKK